MKQIPSAEEFLEKENLPDSLSGGTLKYAMIEFAKMHVEAALEAAAENVGMKKECGCKTESECYAVICCDTVIDKESILDAYPENLIQ